MDKCVPVIVGTMVPEMREQKTRYCASRAESERIAGWAVARDTSKRERGVGASPAVATVEPNSKQTEIVDKLTDHRLSVLCSSPRVRYRTFYSAPNTATIKLSQILLSQLSTTNEDKENNQHIFFILPVK